MNLLNAVKTLLELNKQGISAHIEGTMPDTQIKLNKEYPDSAPLELWGTKVNEPTVWEYLRMWNPWGTRVNDPTVWEYLGLWNPTIDEWESKRWQVKYDN